MARRTDRKKKAAAKRAAADVLTPEDVATRLGIGRNQAYQAIARGDIPALRFGRRWLIPRMAFERLLTETPSAAA